MPFTRIAGYGYIMPPKLIPELLKRIQETRIIAMEDVFFTGERLSQLGLRQ